MDAAKKNPDGRFAGEVIDVRAPGEKRWPKRLGPDGPRLASLPHGGTGFAYPAPRALREVVHLSLVIRESADTVRPWVGDGW